MSKPTSSSPPWKKAKTESVAHETQPKPDAEELESPALIAVSAKRESNEENAAAYRSNTLKHRPPTFEFIPPEELRKRQDAPVYFKEVKLPRAEQTHEICYEPKTQCVFVSQQSSCILARIPINQNVNGFLHDEQHAWQIGRADVNGKGIEGIHNISLSSSHPGCLWISLQYSNQLLLVDVTEGNTLRVKYILQGPTVLKENGQTTHVGGPHCIRECPKTGEIWTALKGALKDSPCAKPGRRARTRSSCCDPVQLEASMTELRKHGFDTPIPDG